MPKDIREFLIGVVAVSSLSACVESFTARHILLGLLLLLFLYGDWDKTRTKTYDKLVYAIVAGGCFLLFCGYFTDELLAWLEIASLRDAVYFVVWALSAILVFITDGLIHRER